MKTLLRFWSALAAIVTKRSSATQVAIIPVQFVTHTSVVFGPETIVTATDPAGEPRKVKYHPRGHIDRWLSAKVREYNPATDKFKLARRAHPIYRRAHLNPVA